MDTSETYIKMSEKAEEIRKKWRFSVGDFYCDRRENYKSVGIITQPFDYDENAVSSMFPLPRQDQSQAIICIDLLKERHWWHEGISLNECLVWGMIDFVDKGCYDYVFKMAEYSLQFTSMEQLWLAFVMKEKYDKVWNGIDWVKEGK